MSGREKERGKGTARKKSKADPHQNDLLDEALDESFPASDPPSQTQPKPDRRRD